MLQIAHRELWKSKLLELTSSSCWMLSARFKFLQKNAEAQTRAIDFQNELPYTEETKRVGRELTALLYNSRYAGISQNNYRFIPKTNCEE